MWNSLRRFVLVSKSLAFTVVIHGALIALLLFSFNWVDEIERGGGEVIQAVAVSEQDILAQIARDEAAEAQRKKEEQQAAANLAELQRQQEQAQKKLAQLEREAEQRRQREQQARAQAEAEKKRKAEEERRAEAQRVAAEKKRKEEEAARKKAEAEKKRRAEEARKKAEAEKKRKEEEERKKREAEKQRKAEEAARRAAEEQLQKRLAEEQRQREQAQRAETKRAAEGALGASTERIKAAVERNWRRPPVSQSGLTAIIQVRVKPDGAVVSARVIQGSGDRLFDESAVIAVQKASPLPFPDNPKYYEFINKFNFKFNPDDG